MNIKRIFLTAAALSFAVSAQAAEQLKPEDAIKYRQAGYKFISWNMGKIKDNLESGSYNKAGAIAAANAIAAIANSGMGALYIPGSEQSAGSVKTYVKPEFFTRQQDVARLAQAFNKEANEMVRVVASTEDVAALKTQFGKLGGTCKACHDDFKARN
ncbi:MAG: cytochrome c [Zoogloeaceae bacterium]|jgi:cytochrome c556|nr:cytochrome c [Zoogloeaceae bacterium]